MSRREQVLRAAAALLLVAVLVALVIRDRSGSDDTATPEGPDRIVTTPDGEPDPTATDPTATDPTDVVPSPPAGLEALVCEQFNKPVKLRVLSFNTHRSTGSLESIVQEILELQPDIALLQEVDRRMIRSGGVDQADLLADAVGMNGSFSPNLVRGTGTYGTLVLSRFDILQEGRISLVGTPRGEPRGLQWALVDISGQAVRLYNTHLDARRPSARLRQARQVADIVREDEAPLILGGDLNAWPGSPAVGALSRVLTETWAVAGEGRAATGRGGHKIDYLFVNGLRPLRSQVATSLVSDHDRLWADLRLASPEKCGD